jgi:predicted flavoprotein YhiN
MAALAADGGDAHGGERRVAVVGGGVSGLFCASTLSAYGYNVSLFDMGKTTPGRRL